MFCGSSLRSVVVGFNDMQLFSYIDPGVGSIIFQVVVAGRPGAAAASSALLYGSFITACYALLATRGAKRTAALFQFLTPTIPLQIQVRSVWSTITIPRVSLCLYDLGIVCDWYVTVGGIAVH